MITTLDQLAQYIRQNIPEPRALASLNVYEKSGFVRFRWHASEFIVKKSLEVFEVKKQNLLVTGESMLMQLLFKRTEKRERVLSALVDSMNEVVGLMEDKEQVESGLKLLEGVKVTLRNLEHTNGTARPSAPKPAPDNSQCVPA